MYKDIQGLTVDARGSLNQMTGNVNKLSDQIGTNITKVSDQVEGITSKINNGEGSIGKLLTSNELYNQFDSIASQMRTKLALISDNALLTSAELRDAAAKFALSGGRFAEDAEALKHNFLLKGYFESRGYWDAPDFEQTIDRKIDSLNQLNRTLQDRLRDQRMQPAAH